MTLKRRPVDESRQRRREDEPFRQLTVALQSSKEMTQEANPRLLVVDDNHDLCQWVAQYLELEGFAFSRCSYRRRGRSDRSRGQS